MSTPTRDVEASIFFLSEKDGGRKKGAMTGYRPQFYYEGHDWDAEHEYPDVTMAMPGQKVRAYLRFMSPAEHFGRVYAGMPFLLREGSKIVGYGVITALLDLEASARPGRW
jgi:translation elongation factor EF-Tu-like GTPase